VNGWYVFSVDDAQLNMLVHALKIHEQHDIFDSVKLYARAWPLIQLYAAFV
jgi:hypothetical protein